MLQFAWNCAKATDFISMKQLKKAVAAFSEPTTTAKEEMDHLADVLTVCDRSDGMFVLINTRVSPFSPSICHIAPSGYFSQCLKLKITFSLLLFNGCYCLSPPSLHHLSFGMKGKLWASFPPPKACQLQTQAGREIIPLFLLVTHL